MEIWRKPQAPSDFVHCWRSQHLAVVLTRVLLCLSFKATPLTWLKHACCLAMAGLLLLKPVLCGPLQDILTDLVISLWFWSNTKLKQLPWKLRAVQTCAKPRFWFNLSSTPYSYKNFKIKKVTQQWGSYNYVIQMCCYFTDLFRPVCILLNLSCFLGTRVKKEEKKKKARNAPCKTD